ncbi:MAG: serine/threonine-protein kinase [Planctomycetota bacterium]
MDESRDPLDLLTEQFLRQYRAGEPVTTDSFADRHPEHAEALRELLPALVALEQMKRDRESSGSGAQRVALPKLERLGDFRIVSELGRGGMGVVFEAVQESLDRRVALKVLPQAALLSGNQLERFQREAQTAARLHHTNIVPVYGSGESDGYHWYAMQFINGQSLDRWREQQAQRPPEGAGAWTARARFVARVGAAAAAALHCAHGMGTLHRDIKPGNFLLDQDDHLWVTDFGLAKSLEQVGLTHSGDLVGTLQYMAPEQFAGHYDVRSEVYALGVTLYELLTLKPAFRGKNRSELMERVRDQRLELSLHALDGVPRDLAVVVEKAMAREPKDRYRDAEALHDDLEAFLEDRPIQARRLSAVAAGWRWCRRNRGLAAAIGAAVLAVIGAAVTGWVAYVTTGDALLREQQASQTAKQESERAVRESQRAEANLKLTLAGFGEVFDRLVGRDPTVAVEEDPDTGEQTLVAPTPLSKRDVELMQVMVTVYDQFAAENAENESLRYETARAYRRVGAIHTRLGKASNVEVAVAAFEKARAGFEGITGRDVQRDLAGVQIELGLAYERLRRHDDAEASLRDGLHRYEAMPNADSAAVRFERAKALFALARNAVISSGRRAGRGLGALSEVRQARQLALDLLAESSDDPEVQALQARTQVMLARIVRRPGRGEPSGDDRAERDRALDEAVKTLRQLVAAHPDRADYRFELCDAILEDQRGPRGPMGREQDPDAAQGVLLLREADAAAQFLYESQPLFQEYAALLGRVRTELARALVGQARAAEGAQRAAVEAEVEALLQKALEVQGDLIAEQGPVDARFANQVCATLGELGRFCLAHGNRQAARAHAVAALDLLARVAGNGQAAEGPPSRSALPGRGERPGRRVEEDGRELRPFEDLVWRLHDEDLLQRLERLRPGGPRRPR